MHANCANYHRPGGAAQGDMDLHFSASFAEINTCDVMPQNGDLGVDNARLIVPGDSEHSILYLRMINESGERMPPIASHLVDQQGAALISEWIQLVAGCG